MKKYTFRLATVLRVRRIQEDQAKAAAMLANREVSLARNVVDQREDHYARQIARTSAAANTSSSMNEFIAYRALTRMAAEGIDYAQDLLDKAEVVADERRDDWKERRRKVQMLERLDERRREEHRIELEHEETIEVDDIVVSQFRRTR